MTVASELVSNHTPGGSERELLRLIKGRDDLRPAFTTTWRSLSARFDDSQIEHWADCVLRLFHINAGRSCLVTFWLESARAATMEESLEAGGSAAEICRHADAKAATAALRKMPTARRLFGAGANLDAWWRILRDLSRRAPHCVEPLVAAFEILTPDGDIATIEEFVAIGMKLAAGDKSRQYAFFSLQDPAARRMAGRSRGAIRFADVERETKAYLTLLWKQIPVLRGVHDDDNRNTQRRSSTAGELILLPDHYRGIEGDAMRPLYRAAAAHAQAHRIYGGKRFVVGQLKPLQVALVTLMEDARVETLAIRALPGLHRLWAPFHVARADGPIAAPMLMARLARALIDAAYVDTNGFIEKACRLFASARDRIDDPAISREIGMLLGNDLGQMRVQFNSKTYVVEPIYRDDGRGLWEFPPEDTPPHAMEMSIDLAKMDRRETGESDAVEDGASKPESPPKTKPMGQSERGVVVATYPEWDREQGIERADWTTIREVTATWRDPRNLERELDRIAPLCNRIRTLVRGTRVGRAVRVNRQEEGHDIDLNAMLECGIALRSGQQPDTRIFRSSVAKHRDIATLLLIDVSVSTGDILTAGNTILDMERLAVAVLAEAMDQLQDPFSLLAFASDGRDDVRMTEIKSFAEAYGAPCLGRLAGLSPGLSTRLGAALRHAGHLIAQTRSHRKLLIVLTDGEPSDIDVQDPLDLLEDARHAARRLHSAGIDCFGIVLGAGGMKSATRVFGLGNTMLIKRIEDLPKRLSELYFRVANR